MPKTFIYTSYLQLLRTEEDMVFIYRTSIQPFGNYRMVSGGKQGEDILSEVMKNMN